MILQTENLERGALSFWIAMGDVPLSLYRFACPRCARILKAPPRLEGKAGMCPACEGEIIFPALPLAVDSWTVGQVLAVISEGDVSVEEQTLDRVGLLLAQGTCLEYTMAREQLPERMAARQWRRLLILAGSREVIRLEVARKMEESGWPGMGEAFDDHADLAAGQAGRVMARYLHFNRHGVCGKCARDRTGMECVYQSFERFLEAARWEEARARKWGRAMEQVLGVRGEVKN